MNDGIGLRWVVLKVTTCDVIQELKVLFGLSRVIGMVDWWTYASTQAKKVNIRKRQLQAPKWFNIIILLVFYNLIESLFVNKSFDHLPPYSLHVIVSHTKCHANKNIRILNLCCFAHAQVMAKRKGSFPNHFMMLRSSIESWKGLFFPLYDSWLFTSINWPVVVRMEESLPFLTLVFKNIFVQECKNQWSSSWFIHHSLQTWVTRHNNNLELWFGASVQMNCHVLENPYTSTQLWSLSFCNTYVLALKYFLRIWLCTIFEERRWRCNQICKQWRQKLWPNHQRQELL